jgi:hypothetical protein
MEDSSLNQFIIKVLDYYDKQTLMYYEHITNNNVKINENTNEIIFNDETKYNYELLGYFDNANNIWIWGWILPQYNIKETRIARNLLDYGLKLEPETNITEHLYIKSLLVNSKISIDTSIQLDINLAIYSYLSHDRFLFIYPYKVLSEDKKNYITLYYLIK